ncbi:MAG TPA: diol dehydratase small subunit [Dongiaceae bacterium]|nr:diol dehydratase small subunit [Dongiaceae bacterium]
MKNDRRPPLDEPDPRRKVSRAAADDLTLGRLRAGGLAPDDLTISRETLLAQAERAESEGYPQLARNFRRAAELTAIPNDVLLQTYEKLRPYRATYYELLALSQEISARYDAPETGEYIRQAAEACRAKGLLASESGGAGET